MSDPKAVIDRALQAWRARDAEAFARCYAEDATIHAPGGVELRGPEGAKQFLATWNEGVPDNDVTLTNEHVCGSVLVQEAVFTGTHTGALQAPNGEVIPATGRSLSARYAEVFEIEGDRIASDRLYFDQVELLIQLGLMPDPAVAAS
ncbi:MAG: ester cyclase [Solirubrobacteraceae bacterium]